MTEYVPAFPFSGIYVMKSERGLPYGVAQTISQSYTRTIGNGSYALIALDPGPTVELTTDTVLTILEILEERIGKEPTPELDAAWKRIKAEHLK